MTLRTIIRRTLAAGILLFALYAGGSIQNNAPGALLLALAAAVLLSLVVVSLGRQRVS